MDTLGANLCVILFLRRATHWLLATSTEFDLHILALSLSYHLVNGAQSYYHWTSILFFDSTTIYPKSPRAQNFFLVIELPLDIT